MNLRRREISLEGDKDRCSLCDGSAVESVLHCDVERGIWQHVFRWLGLVIVYPLNLFTLCALMVESYYSVDVGEY